MTALGFVFFIVGWFLAGVTIRGPRNWLDRAGDGLMFAGGVILLALIAKLLWQVAP